MFELTPFARRTYNPFKEMEEMENALFGGRTTLPDFKTDIRDKGDALELKADLPGMKKEDIHVNIEDGYLTITATRNEEKEEKKDAYVRRERHVGTFTRSFDISSIKADEIKGSYTDGVLTLTLPKKTKEVPTSRRLELE